MVVKPGHLLRSVPLLRPAGHNLPPYKAIFYALRDGGWQIYTPPSILDAIGWWKLVLPEFGNILDFRPHQPAGPLKISKEVWIQLAA